VSILAVAVLIVGAPAKAQDGKVTIFAGYSFATNNVETDDPGLHGYALSGAYNFNKYIGLEANFSGHNGSPTMFSRTPTSSDTGANDVADEDLYTYVFGPKLTLPVGNFSLFTHILVGGSHTRVGETDKCVPVTGSSTPCANFGTFGGSGSGMAVKTGGGVDWNHGRWGIRILEVDYVHSQIFETETCSGCQTDGFDTSWSGVEMSAGVKFNFGKK
jgi:Outer membrane protein beta-barrel domain